MNLRIFPLLVFLFMATFCIELTQSWMKFNSYTSKKRTDLKKRCPNVSVFFFSVFCIKKAKNIVYNNQNSISDS